VNKGEIGLVVRLVAIDDRFRLGSKLSYLTPDLEEVRFLGVSKIINLCGRAIFYLWPDSC
jgi:hypothetical protein